ARVPLVCAAARHRGERQRRTANRSGAAARTRCRGAARRTRRRAAVVRRRALRPAEQHQPGPLAALHSGWMNAPLKVGLGLAGVLLAVYAVLLALLWWKQEALLFQPAPLPMDFPLATEADVHEEVVQVPGARLSVLQLRLPHPKGVVFFLH